MKIDNTGFINRNSEQCSRLRVMLVKAEKRLEKARLRFETAMAISMGTGRTTPRKDIKYLYSKVKKQQEIVDTAKEDIKRLEDANEALTEQ